MVEDNAIKAPKSPFAMRENEIKVFDGKDGYYVYHSGTRFEGDKIVTNGGRVLGVTATGSSLREARANAYKATEWIDFSNKYMRHDIGKAIDEAN